MKPDAHTVARSVVLPLAGDLSWFRKGRMIEDIDPSLDLQQARVIAASRCSLRKLRASLCGGLATDVLGHLVERRTPGHQGPGLYGERVIEFDAETKEVFADVTDHPALGQQERWRSSADAARDHLAV